MKKLALLLAVIAAITLAVALSVTVGAWGTPTECIPGDGNLDGVVDGGDIMAARYMHLGYYVDLTVTSDGCCPITVTTAWGSCGCGGGCVVDPGDTKTFYNIYATETVTVSADDSDSCCVFDSWSDGGDKCHDIVMVLAEDVDVTATCTLLDSDLTVNSCGCCAVNVTWDNNSVTVSAGDFEVFPDIPCCTNVTVTAVTTDDCFCDDIDVDSALPGCQCEDPAENCPEVVVHMDGNDHVVDVCCHEELEPPIPEPCCYCIYEATYYECESLAHPELCEEMPVPGVTEFDAQEYYARHTDYQREAGYEVPDCVPATTVAAPCYEYHTQFYDMNWVLGDPLAGTCPKRYAGALGFMVELVDMAGWMDKESLTSYVTLFEVDILIGAGKASMYVWAINKLDGWVINPGGNAGWPYAVGNEWVTHTVALGGGVDTWTYSIVSGTTTLPKPADVANPVYPSGTLECYQVDGYTWTDANGDDVVDPEECVANGISYYHNNYGCQILEIVFPGLILQGWEWRWLQWYCHAPNWPEPPPELPWWTPAP